MLGLKERDVLSHVGRHIGRYRILEQLGQGGMSVVYKGLDTALDREVAVKVLHPHLSGKEESRRRLAREAKAVAKLHHPNILEVFDFSSVEAEDAYLVTEYIRGQTLRELAEKERFDPPEIAAMVVHQLASALSHAHQSGVIHRDLKPENVMVRDDGVLKLMDFGIAKIVDRDEKMTMTGALVGSPAHMAPEIIEGEEAGAEADVFSLGTILYLLAAGRLPFLGGNATATLKKILDGAYEDPRKLRPAVSDQLAEILSRCLSRSPSARYPNGAALRDALEGYLGSLGLTRIGEELAAFFADPAGYRSRLLPRLADALLSQASKYREDRRPARALGCLNQVLALAPQEPRALALLEQMNVARSREQARARWIRRAQYGAEILAFAGAVALAWWLMPPPPPEGEVRVPAFAAPTLPPPPPVDEAPMLEAPAGARPAAPKIAQVTVRVRPFGYVQVDGGPRSHDALQQHELRLAVGRHLLRVTCDLGCDEVAKEIVVREGANLESIPVRLKPSPLSFEYEPADAEVRIGAEVRRASDTAAHPFVIDSPEGPRKLQHLVSYEVTRPGFATASETVWIEAGKPVTLRGRLAPR